MHILNVNAGPKIDYVVEGNKICFNDELTLNLEKYERDFDVVVDICSDLNDSLRVGLGEKYVAQIHIPPRKYEDTEIINPDYNEDDENSCKTLNIINAVPFDIEGVELRLFSV